MSEEKVEKVEKVELIKEATVEETVSASKEELKKIEKSTEEPKEEPAVELKIVVNEPDSKQSETKEDTKEIDEESILFIEEDDVFDVSVNYIIINGKLFVDGVDEEYKDENHKTITTTFKRPNHGDCEMISTNARMRGLAGNPTEYNVRDFQAIECVRMLVLIRDWSLKSELTEENVLKLDHKIIHAILDVLRDEIEHIGLM